MYFFIILIIYFVDYVFQNSSSSGSYCCWYFYDCQVREKEFCRYFFNFISHSQLGSILSIVILPSFTRSPTAHQMSIQKCEVLDGKVNDIRDYSSMWIFIYLSFLKFFLFVQFRCIFWLCFRLFQSFVLFHFFIVNIVDKKKMKLNIMQWLSIQILN